MPGHSGGGSADNSHATDDLSFPSTVHGFRVCVWGGGGGGGGGRGRGGLSGEHLVSAILGSIQNGHLYL